jgi:hypothetical protein
MRQRAFLESDCVISIAAVWSASTTGFPSITRISAAPLINCWELLAESFAGLQRLVSNKLFKAEVETPRKSQTSKMQSRQR